jgi:hypothetical protein
MASVTRKLRAQIENTKTASTQIFGNRRQQHKKHLPVAATASTGHSASSCVELVPVESPSQKARKPRESDEVMIHYGTIASENQVVRDGCTRDRLGSELGGILCFEGEAAGLMNSFPCLLSAASATTPTRTRTMCGSRMRRQQQQRTRRKCCR